jgi:glucose-6-phosphate 1-epimerase
MEAEGRPQFRATLHVEVTEVLRTSLRVENVGESAFTFEEALHTYLHVGSTSSAELEGLEGARYLDATRAGMPVVVQGQEPLRFEGPIDRIYSSSSDVTLRDSQLNRSIEISAEGSARTVVWNPGEEAGNAMGDMAAGEWDSFVCVETANCRENAVTLDPGQSHTLSQTLAVAAFRSELQQ